jgi:hypothetical protein
MHPRISGSRFPEIFNKKMKHTLCKNGSIHLAGLQKKYRTRVSFSARTALNKAARLLKYSKKVDLVIFDAEDWDVHPKLDLSAHARVYYIDIKICFYRKNINLDTVIDVSLPATIHHELSHVVRANTVGYPETLLDAFIEEGVACFIEESIMSGQNIPYVQPIQGEDNLLKQARSVFSQTISTELHNKWFFGTEEIPEWTGYRLGYLMVKSYMSTHNVSLDKLTRTKAQEILLGC